jgi:hypothetical protein
MGRSYYPMAQHAVRRIEAEIRDESWKQEHERAMQVFGLEGFFSELQLAVDRMLRVDNYIHGRAARERNADLIEKWNSQFEAFLNVAKAGIDKVLIASQQLRIWNYKDTRITRHELRSLEARVRHAMQSLQEWKEWKPGTGGRSP